MRGPFGSLEKPEGAKSTRAGVYIRIMKPEVGAVIVAENNYIATGSGKLHILNLRGQVTSALGERGGAGQWSRASCFRSHGSCVKQITGRFESDGCR